MLKKHMTPMDIAQHLEELQRPAVPAAKPDDPEPEGLDGGAGVPAPLRPLVPTLSGGNARRMPDPLETEQHAA